MSQAGTLSATSVGPAGPITTLTGNSGGAVPPTAGNINIVAAVGSGTFAGNPGTSTLTYSLPTTVPEDFNTDAGTATPALGVLEILGSGLVTTSGAGNTVTINVPALPATTVFFSAFKSATTANATGDGTTATVIFDTAPSNIGAGYNTATGVFTAPTTGLYAFYSSVTVTGVGPLHNAFEMAFAGSVESINTDTINVGVAYSPILSDSYSSTSSIVIQMTAGDTMSVAVTASGSTLTMGIYGAALPGYLTWFRGYKIA